MLKSVIDAVSLLATVGGAVMIFAARREVGQLLIAGTMPGAKLAFQKHRRRLSFGLDLIAVSMVIQIVDLLVL